MDCTAKEAIDKAVQTHLFKERICDTCGDFIVANQQANQLLLTLLQDMADSVGGPRGAPELRSPCTMSRECRKAMPDAISMAVASTVRMLAVPPGSVRNQPPMMASCQAADTRSIQAG